MKPKQEKAQWNLSGQVLEVYGAGEFAPINEAESVTTDDWMDYGPWPNFCSQEWAPWLREKFGSSCDTQIRTIIFRDGVTSVQYEFRENDTVFTGCSALQDVYISASVKDISPLAFYGISDVVIHAPAGSYAEQYAKKHGLTFKVLSKTDKVAVQKKRQPK